MKTASYWVFAAVAITRTSFGQQELHGQVKVLSVCEVLGNVNRYADTAVAVVGRMERSVGLIDHYEFLSQDRCENPVITHGHTWSNKIQIWTASEEGMRKPPSDRPKLERAAIAAKLSVVRKTTKLGSHEEPRLDVGGHPSTATVPNEWAAVYGRIVKVPRLEDYCGPEGCGGRDVPLIIMAEPDQVHTLRGDGRTLPRDD